MDIQAVRPRVFLYPLGVWVLMVVLAVLNGGLREVVLIPRVGAYPGYVLSTAVLTTVILVLSFLYFTNTPIAYLPVELLLVGTLWTALTVDSEFLVGYLEGIPVTVTLVQYNVFAGQVWILVSLVLFCSPLVFGWYLTN